MKRKYILMILICSLTFIGCKDINYANSTINNKPATSTTNNQDKIPPLTEPQKDIKPLDNDDFIVTYNNVSLSLGNDAGKVLQQLGQGTANENNNFGFVGYHDENKYKIFMHGYPTSSPIVTLYSKVTISDGTSIISQLDITNLGTNRGLGKKDSYSKMIALYGNPKKEVTENNITKCSYSFENKELDIFYNSIKEIVQILLVDTD